MRRLRTKNELNKMRVRALSSTSTSVFSRLQLKYSSAYLNLLRPRNNILANRLLPKARKLPELIYTQSKQEDQDQEAKAPHPSIFASSRFWQLYWKKN